MSTENIGFTYSADNYVFKNLNLQVEEGQIISIVGPSGAGKSTLLKCIVGHQQLSNGTIYFENHKILGPKEKLVAGHPEIALVNQLFELDDYFTVSENVSNRLHHLSVSARVEFVDELLDLFELNKLRNVKSKDISGGEQQRLSMACALAKEPKLLLLDEPFVHLDAHLTKKIGDYIKALAEIRNMSVILVTHNGVEALSWSDKIVMMYDGSLQSSFSPTTAYFEPKNTFEGSFFGELNELSIDGKNKIFRPIEFSEKKEADQKKVYVKWKSADFKGAYYANYFEVNDNNKTNEIVLYSASEMKSTTHIYV